MVAKREQTQTFNSSLVLTCLFTGYNGPFAAPSNFHLLTSLWLVLNSVFTFSCLAVNSQKDMSHPLTSASRVGGVKTFTSARICAHDPQTSSFPLSFLITTSASVWLFGDCYIYLFIYLISIFYESFSYVTVMTLNRIWW